MISVAEALERLFTLMPVMSTERVALTEAFGRVLAEDVTAQRTQPPFSASAMDGYAVRHGDAAAGATLRVIGEAAAGHGFRETVGAGDAVRIFTGAPMPVGTDSVLIQENAERAGDNVSVREQPKASEYVRPSGGDFREGDRIASPRRISSRDLALFAAMDVADVLVYRRPVVALIPTGDELVLPGQSRGPDQIVSSNNFGLAGLCQQIGAEPRLCPIARDSRESLVAALDHARGADVIVTLGGASVGDHDLVAQVFGEQGLTLDFYKIRMRPGKPLMAGRLGDAVMIGLPGNPVSAMVCGEIFLRPALEAAMGLPARPRATRPARLAHDIGPNGPREHYMRAILHDDGTCEVFDNQDSSLVRTLATANALVVREPDAPHLPKNSRIACIPL